MRWCGVRQPGTEDIAGFVAEATPERLEHPRPAVGGRAAAESQHHGLGTGVQCGHQELAGSIGGRSGRGPRRRSWLGQQVQAGGLRQLDDGRRPPRGEDCRHRVTERSKDRDFARAEPARDGGLDGPFASVGDGQVTTRRPGWASVMPEARDMATSRAVSDPLNLSGATRTARRVFEVTGPRVTG